ncbi:unannotated protein [freshwater metagenome]|uniref:Unannotated protein n=1 Tax=freshwater metagenome TaxID=449393 RepID=A0A6J6Z3I5_9ZZZZ
MAAAISALSVPVTTKLGPTISKPSMVLPALARPRASAGMVTSRRYFSVVKPWQMKPSHTSPATSVINSPTPARKIFGTPYALMSEAAGAKKGVINVCV